jgi:hypothetical protein
MHGSRHSRITKSGSIRGTSQAITEVLVTETELENNVAPLHKTMRAISDDVVTLLLSVFHLDKTNVDISSHPNSWPLSENEMDGRHIRALQKGNRDYMTRHETNR